MNMTYGDLLKILLQATACELEQNVTIFEPGLGEFYPVASESRVSGEAKNCPADGILDDGHLFLEVAQGWDIFWRMGHIKSHHDRGYRMKWYYVRYEGSAIGPAISPKDKATDLVNFGTDGIMFNENIFSPPDLPESVLLEDGVKEAILRLLSSDSLSESDRKEIVVLITRLSRPRVVTGSIEGGVLSLGEVSEGVEVDIRDYDTEGVNPKFLHTDENDDEYFEAG